MKRILVLATLVGASMAQAQTTYVRTSFEADGTPAYNPGVLAGQNTWLQPSFYPQNVSTAQARTGAQGVELDSLQLITSHGAIWRIPTANAPTTGIGLAEVWVRDTAPTVGSRAATGLRLTNTGGTQVGALVMGGNGSAYVRGAAAQAAVNLGVTLPIDTWHRLQLAVRFNGANSQIQAFVNGTQTGAAITNAQATSIGDTVLQMYAFGTIASQYGVDAIDGAGNTGYWDDFSVVQYPLGSLRGDASSSTGAPTAFISGAATIDLVDASNNLVATYATNIFAGTTFNRTVTQRGTFGIRIKPSFHLSKLWTGQNITDWGVINLDQVYTAGDVDNDNEVGPGDLQAILDTFGNPSTASDDIDRDGEVGPGDLQIVLDNFGIQGE
jgi:hypothetical protein